MRPFVENLERQKRFVTDASHELKTPLAILAADVELLRQPNTEQKWIDSAQAQITRMDKLIKNLVELARTEETIEDSAVTSFSLSEVAQASVEGFQPLAEAEGKRLEAHIPPAVELLSLIHISLLKEAAEVVSKEVTPLPSPSADTVSPWAIGMMAR